MAVGGLGLSIVFLFVATARSVDETGFQASWPDGLLVRRQVSTSNQCPMANVFHVPQTSHHI